jgi:hypothetical protein
VLECCAKSELHPRSGLGVLNGRDQSLRRRCLCEFHFSALMDSRRLILNNALVPLAWQ